MKIIIYLILYFFCFAVYGQTNPWTAKSHNYYEYIPKINKLRKKDYIKSAKISIVSFTMNGKPTNNDKIVMLDGNTVKFVLTLDKLETDYPMWALIRFNKDLFGGAKAEDKGKLNLINGKLVYEWQIEIPDDKICSAELHIFLKGEEYDDFRINTFYNTFKKSISAAKPAVAITKPVETEIGKEAQNKLRDSLSKPQVVVANREQMVSKGVSVPSTSESQKNLIVLTTENAELNPPQQTILLRQKKECEQYWKQIDKKNQMQVEQFKAKRCLLCEIECKEAETALLAIKTETEEKTEAEKERDVEEKRRKRIISYQRISEREITVSRNLDTVSIIIFDKEGHILKDTKIEIEKIADKRYKIIGGEGFEKIQIMTQDSAQMTFELDKTLLKWDKVVLDSLTGVLSFMISGGNAPYRLVVKDGEDFLIATEKIAGNTFEMNLQKWLAEKQADIGTYTFYIEDATNESINDKRSYHYRKAEPFNWVLWISLFLLAIIGISWYFWYKQQQESESKILRRK